MEATRSILTTRTRRLITEHIDEEKKMTINLEAESLLTCKNKNKRKMSDVSKTILYVVANIKKRKMMNDMSEEYMSRHILNEKKKSLTNINKRKKFDVYKARNITRRMLKYNSEMPRKKRRSSRCDSYLPEELIFNVLSSTCVTSLLRCKSVCKLWRSIISNPVFMNAHHVNSINRLPSIMMITSSIDDDQGCRGATILYHNSSRGDLVNIPLLPPFDNLEFVSSFNGVVCVFSKFYGDIYLLNPLTRMSKKLTLPPGVATEAPHFASTDPNFDYIPPLLKAWKIDVGFGFDCVSHEFKVLFIEYRNADLAHADLAAVNLYSSNSDSWRSIEVSNDLPSLLYYDPFCPILRSGPVVDGVLYMEGADVIITFDLHNELFGLISYPSFVHTRKSNVLDFEGSVAVVLETVTDGSLVEKELSLWTLVAVSDEMVWNKMFTLSSGSEEIDWLFLYSGANQFFGKTRSGEMLYDYRKKQTNCVALPSQNFLLKVLNHTESFLSAEGLDGFKDS